MHILALSQLCRKSCNDYLYPLQKHQMPGQLTSVAPRCASHDGQAQSAPRRTSRFRLQLVEKLDGRKSLINKGVLCVCDVAELLFWWLFDKCKGSLQYTGPIKLWVFRQNTQPYALRYLKICSPFSTKICISRISRPKQTGRHWIKPAYLELPSPCFKKA